MHNCRIANWFVLGALALTLCAGSAAAAEPRAVEPLAKAHAHNDYLHERPLLDALDHGFTSVEADIFLVDGELLVAHEKRSLKPERTLKALYLDPLRDRVRRSGGSVYPGGERFTLLIDLKSEGESTYAVLAKVLADYADIVTVVRDGQATPKAVDVVVSGDRPIETMAAETVRYAGVDGRLSDLDSDLPAHLIPLISDNWGMAFRWKGKGPLSEADRDKLDEAVAKAHAHGRRVRFWATPETLAAWQLLAESGVDMINTDDLAGLEKFLRRRSSAASDNRE